MRILRTFIVLTGAVMVAAALSYALDPAGSQRALGMLSTVYRVATHVAAEEPVLPITMADTPAFRFASVERGSIEQSVTVTGMLQPVKTVEVSSQLSGQVAKLYVDFNDTVRKGEPLAQIDPRTFKAKVDEAKSILDEALANVKIAEAKLDRAKIDLANAGAQKEILKAKLDSAKALLASAERNVGRKSTLQAHNVASVTSVEDAQTDLVSKTAQEREAQKLLELNSFAVDGAAADLRRLQSELEQAQAAVPEKEATLRAAEADLDRTIIRSPIDGVIVGRFVDEGQTLAVGLEARTAFNVAHRLEDMEIQARVDETDIGKITPGQRAYFTVDAYPDRRFYAIVRQVRKAPQVNQNVVTYTVVLATANPDGALLPGMTALVKIIIDHQDDVLKVPLAALRFQPAGVSPEKGSQSVWVRSGRSVRRIPIVVGSAGPEQVALKSGNLSEGDQVAIGQIVRPSSHELFGIRFGS